MTIGINDPISLSNLQPLDTPAKQKTTDSPRPGTRFSDKLDTILTPDAAPKREAVLTPQELAESLKLQMLHSSLALAGDTPTPPTPLPFSRQSAEIQSLLKAYGNNQPVTAENSATPVPGQPLPELNETAAIAPAAIRPTTSTPTRGSEWLDPVILKASQRYGVDPGLIKAVIKAESNFNPNAVSHAGAQGLMQLMPATARSLGVSDSFDPEQNVMGGTRFLRDLLKRYNGDLDSALAAYNWGPGNVDRRPDRLPRETRDYLVRVKQLYSSYTA